MQHENILDTRKASTTTRFGFNAQHILSCENYETTCRAVT